MTINTKDDLLAFLNEDDEFRQAVREALSEDEERMESPDIVSTQNAILRTQNAMLASLADVATTVNRMDKTVGRLGGGELEWEIVNKLPSRLNATFGLRRTRVVLSRGIRTRDTQALLDAVEDSNLTESQKTRIAQTDLIVRALSKETGQVMYVAVEASTTVRESDIERVRYSTEYLQKTFGVDSNGVVVGYEIREEDARRADMDGVTVILLPDPNVLEVD